LYEWHYCAAFIIQKQNDQNKKSIWEECEALKTRKKSEQRSP